MTLAKPPDRGNGQVDAAPSRARGAVRGTWLTPFVLALLGSVTGLLLFTMFWRAPAPPADVDIGAAVATAVAESADAPPRSTEVFRTILPSLVLIRAEGNEERAGASGIGSGVIVNDDGAILTAHHVVDGARAITVVFADGTEASAKVVEAFPDDLAVLRADGAPEIIVPAVLGGSGLRIGDDAFAVGNPLGLTASLSAGVISGLNRTSSVRSGRELAGLIQFDAAVNPGSSGGPLLNRNGQVIGIVTALANPSNERSFTGIGFAVPLGSAGGGPGGPAR